MASNTTSTDPMTTAAAPTSPAPFGDDDPRARFAKAVALGTTVIGAIRPDQLDAPTPCPGFDVRGLVEHLVGVLERVARMGEGADPFAGASEPASIPDAQLLDAWKVAAHAVQRAWTDDAALARPVALPWQQGSAGDVLDATYLSEVLVHTWDLATATGQRPQWDDDVAEFALDALRTVLPDDRAAAFDAARAMLPPDQRDFEDPFGPVVTVPPEAAAIDRLVAWTGRPA